MIDEYNALIKKILKTVHRHIRDDCYQAACLGLVKALNKKESAKNFRSYVYKCMESEVLNEMAVLHDTFPIDNTTFTLLCKYKSAKKNGNILDGLTKDRLYNLEKLCNMKSFSYKETFAEECD